MGKFGEANLGGMEWGALKGAPHLWSPGFVSPKLPLSPPPGLVSPNLPCPSISFWSPVSPFSPQGFVLVKVFSTPLPALFLCALHVLCFIEV